MDEVKSELAKHLDRGDLMRSVFILGKICDPQFDDAAFIEKILELASKVWHRSAKARHDAIFKLQNINTVLFKEFELRSKDDRYKHVIDDPTRLYLHRVLKTKIGSPLTVCALYSILCDQVGVEYQCIALHNNYYLRVSDVAGDFFVDPFDSGRILAEGEFQKKVRSSMQKGRLVQTSLYEVLDVKQVVSRIAHQLKHIYILKSAAFEALRAVEVLTVLYPASPELTRDRGILYCEMEYFSKAIADLHTYLQSRPNADDVKEIRKLTKMLRGYHEIVN